VRPGETLDVTVLLSGDNGLELVRKLSYRVPVGAPAGPLQLTATDASTINLTEYRQLVMSQPKSVEQLLTFLNALRVNTKGYLRVWRAETAYDVAGETLPDPPPSVSALPALANSKLAEIAFDGGDMVVSGTRTIQVEVKDQ
jgi:hypothetical protein